MDRPRPAEPGHLAGEPAREIPRLVERALDGRATVLLLLARDSADAEAAVRGLVLPTLESRQLADEAYTEVSAIAWERELPGAVLERLGLPEVTEADPRLGLADTGPRVLVVTEAGDADPVSLHALSSAVHRLGDAPVLVVLAGALDDCDAGPLAELARAHRGTTCHLERLDAAGVQALAAGVGNTLDEATARRLAKHTDGSAAAVLELLAEQDPDLWKVPDSPLPPTARALRTVRALLAGDDQVRLLVEACAIIGRWAVLEEVATLAELGDPLPVLDRAVDLGVLRTRRASMRLLVGFRSRLVRAAAYESMGVARQRELHIRAARVLADEGARLRQRALAAGGPDAELAAELDDWAARCASGGSWEQAGEAWLAASRMSVSEAEAERRLVDCLDATVSNGNLFEVQALIPELESTSASPLREAVLGYHQLMLGHRDEAEVLLHRAWQQAADDDRATKSAIAHRIALHNLVDWNSAGLVTWAERAIELADGAVPSVPSGLEAHTMLGLGLGGEGRPDAALQAYAKVTSAVRAGAQGQRAMMGQGWLLLALDRVPLAAHELEMAAPISAWRGSTRISLWAYGWLAHARLALGDLSAARAAVDRAIPMLEQTGQNVALPLVHSAGAQIAALRGEIALADEHAAKAASVRTDYQAMLVAATMARAHVSIATGDYAGAVRAFEPLLATQRHAGIDEPGFWPWQDLYAIALIAIGEVQAADEFLRPHEELAAARQHRSTMARLGSARARVLFSTGEVTAGRDAFERALGLISDLPLSLLRTRIHFAQGQALRRVGKRRDAEAELHHARRGYAAMGATGYVERCDRELKAGTRSRDIDSLTELTPQEQAVVELVVQGMTNREVAASLFISVKTVQYHLTRVYARLGVRSRAELTALRHGG
ncbi:helix-turn-helix transcriptional regulator [Enemella evansiae]|uniref:helix-turn-helix transcriptional regulator n=1 Tax=Enemella evansiae TaxID=2016499 RepID=UPI000B95D9A1|nr:LuxR family transcriptional regulator [Enemella evansiae]OYO03532.1 LuxR family transcriptional regulator [Enemella evansiae]